MPIRLCLALCLVPAFVQAGGGPDYDLAESWLARPGIESPALLQPGGGGAGTGGATAVADAFYVHPTTGMDPAVANVPVDNPRAVAMGHLMLDAQASPFGGISRIFAPRYRQASLPVFDLDEDGIQLPMNLAYGDLRRAFRYYVQHDNGGRPFFLVGHSQGSNHALRLLTEEIRGTLLQERMVAAYLPGMPVPRALLDDDLSGIAPCAVPLQTGCVAAWGTFAEGYSDFAAWEEGNHFWDAAERRWRSARGMELVAVNPVSWRMDAELVPASAHLGAMPFGVSGSHGGRIVPNLVGARVVQGYVLVSPVPIPGDLFDDGGIFEPGNYHVFDISLFWADIRANAGARLDAFLEHRAASG